MFVIIIIKVIYSIYTLIYNKEKFEVRNSPLNLFATHLTKVLYCLKTGCAVTAGGALFIAGGAAYDQVLSSANRPQIFIPMMGGVYKHVFGEVPSDFENKFFNLIDPNPPTITGETKQNVTEVLNKFFQALGISGFSIGTYNFINGKIVEQKNAERITSLVNKMNQNFNDLNNNVQTKHSELIKKLTGTGEKIDNVLPDKIKEDLFKDKNYLTKVREHDSLNQLITQKNDEVNKLKNQLEEINNNTSQNFLELKQKLANELSNKTVEFKTLCGKYTDLTSEITTKVNNVVTKHNTDHSTIVKAVEDLISSKSKFIDDFNLIEFLSNLKDYIMNLNYEQNLAFVNLSGIFVIMVTLMSIVSIFYSNKLLNYFNLESRYPKLAKLILLRLKFQQYYLFVNVLIITIVSIIMFALNLTVFF